MGLGLLLDGLMDAMDGPVYAVVASNVTLKSHLGHANAFPTLAKAVHGAADDAAPALALDLDPSNVVAFVALPPVPVLPADEAQGRVVEAMVVVVQAEAVE